jgi:hypothetical protein
MKFILIAVVIPLMLSCSTDRGTDDQTRAVFTATIYEPGEKKPAAGALVKVFDVETADDRPVDLFVTDGSGP